MEDMITRYPEGVYRTLDDALVEELEDYYNKPVSEITENEIQAYEEKMYDQAMSI